MLSIYHQRVYITLVHTKITTPPLPSPPLPSPLLSSYYQYQLPNYPTLKKNHKQTPHIHIHIQCVAYRVSRIAKCQSIKERGNSTSEQVKCDEGYEAEDIEGGRISKDIEGEDI
ncbi:hypothetical protein PTI98_013354 [Pleurotus ostreatus]|nr:hypothetical protein PTI98_013354 [Pleurotus ostreatus]